MYGIFIQNKELRSEALAFDYHDEFLWKKTFIWKVTMGFIVH